MTTSTTVLPRRSRSRHPRLRKVVVLGSAVTLIGGGAAFAYWTTTGSGSGSVTSTTPGTVTVAQTSTITAVNPGRVGQTISGTITNPAGAASATYVTSLTVSIGSVTKAGGAAAGTCDATDYTLTGTTVTIGQDIAVGSSVNWTGPTIAFNNKATNQDQCKGATVNLAYATT